MVHSSDRRASQGHAWGSPKAGGCPWRGPQRCAFRRRLSARRVLILSTSSTMRRDRCGAGARDGCQPRWGLIWESRQEASSRPGQGVAGRGEGSAPRTEGFMREKNPPSVSKVNIAPIDLRATRPRRPRNAAPAALNSFYSQRQAPLKRPRRGRSTTKPHSREAATIAQR